MSWGSKARGRRAHSRSAGAERAVSRVFPQEQAPWEGCSEMHCPYLSTGVHVVSAEPLRWLQQAGRKLPPLWPKTPVCKTARPWSRGTAGRLLAAAEGAAGSAEGALRGAGSCGYRVRRRSLRSAASVERRRWTAAARCRRAAVVLHGERAEVLGAGFYWWLCLQARPCPPSLKGTGSSGRFLFSGCSRQGWREEIGGTDGASFLRVPLLPRGST